MWRWTGQITAHVYRNPAGQIIVTKNPTSTLTSLKIYVHHVVWKGSLPIRKAIVELLQFTPQIHAIQKNSDLVNTSMECVGAANLWPITRLIIYQASNHGYRYWYMIHIDLKPLETLSCGHTFK